MALTQIRTESLAAEVTTAIVSAAGLPPKITSLDYPSDDTAADPAGGQTVIIIGSGFTASSTVFINGNQAGVVSYINATALSFTTPASSAGVASLYVVNSDGGTAIAVPGLLYSGTPTWTTSAGTLGSPYEANSFSVTLQATGDGNVTFHVSTGNTLPSGLTLAANGLLSGTIPATDPTTTYTFYVDAIDAQNQETARTFSVTYTKDAVTWSSPANGAAYSLLAGTANTITLEANSAAGKSITYTVQSGSLPANVSISGANVTGNPNTAQNNTSVVIRATAADTNRFADRTLYFTVTAITNMIRKIAANSNFTDIQVDGSDNIYMIGRDGNAGLIAKFNSTGVCQYIKRVTGYTPVSYRGIDVAANGQFLAYGYVSWGSQYGFITKFDTDGNKIWEQGFTRPYMINNAKFDPDGSGTVWVVAAGQGDTGNDMHLVKMHANGAVSTAWYSTDSRDNGFNDIFIDSTHIYVAGAHNPNWYGNEYNAYIAKLSKSNPTSITWSKMISRTLGTLTEESLHSISVDGSGSVYGLMYGGKVGQYIYEPSVFKLNANGSSFAWIRKMTDLSSQGSYYGGVGRLTISNNNIIVNFKNDEYKQVVLRYDMSGNLAWQREFNIGAAGDANNAIDGGVRSTLKGDYFYNVIPNYNFVYGRTDFTYMTKFNIDGAGANTYDSRLQYKAYTGATEAARTDYILINDGDAFSFPGFNTYSPGVMNGTSLTVSANNPSGLYTITTVL